MSKLPHCLSRMSSLSAQKFPLPRCEICSALVQRNRSESLVLDLLPLSGRTCHYSLCEAQTLHPTIGRKIEFPPDCARWGNAKRINCPVAQPKKMEIPSSTKTSLTRKHQATKRFCQQNLDFLLGWIHQLAFSKTGISDTQQHIGSQIFAAWGGSYEPRTSIGNNDCPGKNHGESSFGSFFLRMYQINSDSRSLD